MKYSSKEVDAENLLAGPASKNGSPESSINKYVYSKQHILVSERS